MSGLKNDCFDCCGGGERLLGVDEALALLAGRLAPVVAVESVKLAAARGRILAAEQVSAIDVPPHDNAAVDGFAVFAADLSQNGETRLPVTGRIAAGHPLGRAAVRGEALRIFTGAPMPAGPDAVVMQEDCHFEGESVVLPAGVKPGANRRRAGEDVARGAVALAAGIRLRPQELGVAAAIGCADLPVFARLRAAVFSTGDEVREPGRVLPPGCIHDANRYTVTAMLEDLGCAVTDLGILPDRLDAITQALDGAAAGHDLIVTSGGVSMGDEDHVKAAVQALGSLHFWRLAIKPGRPLALGQVRGVPFVGLPGNPVAAMVTFHVVARPVVLRLAGLGDVRAHRFRVPAAFALRKKPGRREFLRGRLVEDEGGLAVQRFPADGSGILTSMVWSDGLIDLPEALAEVAPGALVDFLPFAEVAR